MVMRSESAGIPALSRRIRYTIQPTARPKKRVPSPAINLIFLLMNPKTIEMNPCGSFS